MRSAHLAIDGPRPRRLIDRRVRLPHAFAARRRADVLVVAPHPDDDAIGCGGTLARLAAAGGRITVVYVTDGGASHPGSRRFPPERLRDVREGEARSALRRLGVREPPHFLRAPDGGLGQLGAAERARLVARLTALVDAGRTAVFAPWVRDPHPDHVATAALVEAALRAARARPDVLYYRVWLPVRGDAAAHPGAGEASACVRVLTARERARKRCAILAHRSQIGALIDDDPDGFVIDAQLLAGWLGPVERFYRIPAAEAGTSIG
jgi:LmbE family N-acetylglucosaminyl deacetylase